jgi:hypothetical protein
MGSGCAAGWSVTGQGPERNRVPLAGSHQAVLLDGLGFSGDYLECGTFPPDMEWVPMPVLLTGVKLAVGPHPGETMPLTSPVVA